MSDLAIGLSIGGAFAGAAAGFALPLVAFAGDMVKVFVGVVTRDSSIIKDSFMDDLPGPLTCSAIGAAAGAALGYGIGLGAPPAFDYIGSLFQSETTTTQTQNNAVDACRTNAQPGDKIEYKPDGTCTVTLAPKAP